MDKSDRISVELEAEQRRIDAADVLGAKIDELAKDILSDVESGYRNNDYFDDWVDAAIDDCIDNSIKLHQLLYLLYAPNQMFDETGDPHYANIERLARMRAVFADHQEAWAQKEAKQQLEEE